MSTREELNQLTINELQELSNLINKAAKIINDERKKFSELSKEGREIALSLELLSATITVAEIELLKLKK